MESSYTESAQAPSFLKFVNSFRWATWLLAFIFLILKLTPDIPLGKEILLYGLVFVYNLFFTFLPRYVEKYLRRRPLLILVDVAFCTFLIGAYGWRSPFFLYSFAPVLLAGYLWKVKGGFIAAILMGAGYLLVIPFTGYSFPELKRLGLMDTYLAETFDYLLIAIFFSYPSYLISRLNKANKGLENSRLSLEISKRKLETLQEVTAAIQASLELNKILKKIVVSLVKQLNYDAAAIGLVEEKAPNEIDWLFSEPDTNLCFDLEKNAVSPFFARLLKEKKPLSESDIDPADNLFKIIKMKKLTAFPLIGRDQKVLGVLLIRASTPDKQINVSDFDLLRSFAQQAAIAIDNAQRYSHSRADGVFGERLRIATEMHDNIMQNLYGIKLFLDACIKDVGKNTSLANRLNTIRKVFIDTLKDLRFIIDDLYEEQVGRRKLKQLITELAFSVEKTSNIRVELSISGKEQTLSPKVKKDMYLIIREAVSNAQKHAQVDLIRLEITFSKNAVEFCVADNGIGFCLEEIASGSNDGLGLKTIESRAHAHNGIADIESHKNKGTRVIVSIPIKKNLPLF